LCVFCEMVFAFYFFTLYIFTNGVRIVGSKKVLS